jgi:hypothetical protein
MMEITIHVRPEIEARLVAAAQSRGLDLETYAETLLEDAASRAVTSEREWTLEEFCGSLDALTRFSSKIPALPIEAFSRESFYEDHD